MKFDFLGQETVTSVMVEHEVHWNLLQVDTSGKLGAGSPHKEAPAL